MTIAPDTEKARRRVASRLLYDLGLEGLRGHQGPADAGDADIIPVGIPPLT
jgi:hypothetical protein